MDDRDIQIEPCEEIVDRAVSVDRSLLPAQSLSQGPSTSAYNATLMTSVMRPDPRYELALASQVPHTQTEHPDTSAVAATAVTLNLMQVLCGIQMWRCGASNKVCSALTRLYYKSRLN